MCVGIMEEETVVESGDVFLRRHGGAVITGRFQKLLKLYPTKYALFEWLRYEYQ